MQVIVYAGAIVVLFLFVIMLLGVDRSDDLDTEPLVAQRPLAIVVGVVLGAGMSAVVIASTVTGLRGSSAALDPDVPDIEQIGRLLFTDYLFALRDHLGAARDRRRGRGDAGPGQARGPDRRRAGAQCGRRRRGRGGRRVIVAADPVSTEWYLTLGALLFALGAVGLLVRRNPLVMFMCVELMLNAVNLTFVSFARELDDVGGQVVVFFVLVVAAAEVVVGLGIIVSILRRRPGPPPTTPRCSGADRRMLELTWLIPALPLAGFLSSSSTGQPARRAARRLAGDAAVARLVRRLRRRVCSASAVTAARARAHVHPDAVRVAPGRGLLRRRRRSWPTRCRSRCASSSPASPR